VIREDELFASAAVLAFKNRNLQKPKNNKAELV
jgi:hypothetical protein